MMSQKAKTLILSSFLSFLGVCNSACNFGLTNATSTKIKGMFVFGSSLVDNGNNNFLEKCKAKANYLPYGVDYAKGPTGRFTNGKNVIDLLGDHLKLPSLPTFKDPSTKGNVILQGNDFSLNFFKNFPHNNATLTGFISKLITGLSQQIQRLYDMGARKFVVMSVYPNGCSPTVRARVPIPVPTGCIHTINVPLSLYNTNLKSLLDYMMQKMPDSKFVYVDVFNIIKNIVQTPSQYGFDNTIDACCEVTPIKEGGNAALCKNGGQVCPSRNKYVWFDGLHPTEAVNIVLANKAFDSELNTEVYPTNVKKLIEG
ncbi:GDSL esterase/lipase At1g71250-like isoform X2 [Capsicum annuum]|uniref:GDSL esterase/lipase At1g71250-like isoform X2 n=1 Tax=Capsicum annuum TaxID=4072 RepID=UPI001FB16F4F|nr:GDSL esterase/lipase At1g71250-like isoform X2 [Capsicum annuum]